MENISRASILKLSKRVGVTSLSEDTYDVIRNIIIDKIDEIIKTTLLVNSERGTKTIMSEDVFNALEILGHSVTHIQDNNKA